MGEVTKQHHDTLTYLPEPELVQLFEKSDNALTQKRLGGGGGGGGQFDPSLPPSPLWFFEKCNF